MTIGQLASESGLTTDTIRYYETLKLIEPVGRTTSGYRLYDHTSMARIVFIKRAKLLGFSLSEVHALLQLHRSDSGSAQDMLELIEAKITEAQKDIEELTRIKRSLEDLAARCPGGDVPLSDCPIVTFLHSQHESAGD